MATPLHEAWVRSIAPDTVSSEAELDALCRHAPLGIGSLDTALRFRRVNEYLAALHGAPPVAHVGRALDEIHPRAAEQLRAACELALRECVATGPLQIAYGPGADGAGERYGECWVFPLDAESMHLAGVGLAVVDVTGQVLSQRRWAESGGQGEPAGNGLGLQSGDQRDGHSQPGHAHTLESLGLLAGGVAHDFNNLLVSILGNIELALEATPETSPAHGPMRAAADASQRAADLTKQLLALAGSGAVEPELLDLAQEVKSIGRLLRVSLGGHVRLVKRFGVGPFVVRAGAGQIDQVIMNLVINAAEAMPRGGEIEIAVSRKRQIGTPNRLIHGEVERSGEYVVLEVRDAGDGISDDAVSHIFDPFFSTKPNGRGLGLTAVLGIVRTNGWAMAVDTPGDGGAAFRVYIPAASQSEVRPQHNRATTEVTRDRLHGHMLVVDDDPAIRELARRVLAGAGMTVDTADCGEEALAIASRTRAELRAALLDLSMPGLSGEQTLRGLREICPGLPVVLSSGYSRDDAAGRLERHEAVTFLQKPYRPHGLLAAVYSALTGTGGLELSSRGEESEG